MLCRSASLILLLAAICAGPVAAQQNKAKRPGWLPRAMNTGVDGRHSGGEYLTAAERAVINARLEKIEDLFYAIPELAHRRGFNPRPWFSAGTQQDGRLIEYGFALAFFPGDVTRGDADAGGIRVTFNMGPVGLIGDGSSTLRDEKGMEIYTEPRHGDPFPGATLVYGYGFGPNGSGSTNILFTRDRISPWLPVTREEYYKAHLFALEGKNGEKTAAALKAFEKTPYEQWVARAEERKKERAQALALASVAGAAVVAELRKVHEQEDAELAKQLKANHEMDRAMLDEQAASLLAIPRKMRAELDALSAAERKLPAIIDGSKSSAVGFGLTSTEDENTRRMLTPNPALWRVGKSRIEIRSVHVWFEASDIPGVANAIAQTIKKLDWDALRALVNDAPR